MSSIGGPLKRINHTNTREQKYRQEHRIITQVYTQTDCDRLRGSERRLTDSGHTVVGREAKNWQEITQVTIRECKKEQSLKQICYKALLLLLSQTMVRCENKRSVGKS